MLGYILSIYLVTRIRVLQRCQVWYEQWTQLFNIVHNCWTVQQCLSSWYRCFCETQWFLTRRTICRSLNPMRRKRWVSRNYIQVHTFDAFWRWAISGSLHHSRGMPKRGITYISTLSPAFRCAVSVSVLWSSILCWEIRWNFRNWRLQQYTDDDESGFGPRRVSELERDAKTKTKRVKWKSNEGGDKKLAFAGDRLLLSLTHWQKSLNMKKQERKTQYGQFCGRIYFHF